MTSPHTALAGIGFLILALASFAALDTTTRYISAGVPLVMALWVRYAIQAVGTTLVVLPVRGRALFRTAHPRFQLLRGLLLMVTSLLAFTSLRHMPVGEFTAIVAITPLVITLLAATSAGEKVSALRWTLVAGGFAGTLIIIRPGHEAFQWTMLLPLALVACNAWFQLLTSKLAKTEDPVTMHFYTGWIGTIAASFIVPFFWEALASWQLWAGLIFMGFMGTVGHYLLILAYARAPATTLTPYLYLQIAFAMLGGWVAFNHLPDGWALAGMALIAACGAAGAWLTVRESQIAYEPPES